MADQTQTKAQTTTPIFDPDGNLRDVPSQDVDKYLSLSNGRAGQRAISFVNPKTGQQHWVPQSRIKEFLDLGGIVSNPNDLTINPTGKEGTYKMAMKGSTNYASIPYSMIGSAAKAGYIMHPDEQKRYVDDAAADPNLNRGVDLPPGVAIVGRNTAGQPIYGNAPTQQQGSAIRRFMNSAGQAVSDAASGLYHGIVEGPQNPEEAAWMTGPGGGRANMVFNRLIVKPQVDQAKQAAEEFSQAAPTSLHPTPEQLQHRQKAVAHALAAAIPGAGPWAAQVGEKIGEQVASGDIAGAGGTLAGNAAVYEAPHAVVKGVKGVARLPRATMEAITGTSSREVGKLAAKTEAENAAAVEGHAENAADAANAVAEKEQEFNRQVALAAQKAKEDHQAAIDEVAAHNQDVHARAQAAHQSAVQDVNDFNQRVQDKHARDVQDANEFNSALENTLDLRNKTAADLDAATTDYFNEEAKVQTDAKKMENEAWDAWRKKTNSATTTVDVAPLISVIEDQLTRTPDAGKVLSQVESTAGELDPASAEYHDTRNSVIKDNLGVNAPYDDLPDTGPKSKATVDEIMDRIGMKKPINLANPTELSTLTLEEIHNLKTNIGFKRFGRTLEPGTRNALTNIYKALAKLEESETAKLGAANELSNAKEITQKFQDAFGREKYEPVTQDEIRKKEANPEQYKEEKQQQRANAAKVWSNKLVDLNEKVKSLRGLLKTLPDEDKLRVQKKQVPAPPTVGDLREGYNLKEQPVYEPPTEGDLRPSHRLKPVPQPPSGTPTEIATDKVAQQKSTSASDISDLGPDRPVPQTISPEDIEAQKKANLDKSAEVMRQHGVRRALYATMTAMPFALAVMLKEGMSPVQAAELGGLGGMTVLGATHGLANLLQRPEVAKWLSKFNERDAAAASKLPPDQQAIFSSDMRQIVQAADKQKIPVSQNLRAFIAGTAAAQNPEALKKRAEEIQKGENAQWQQTPTGAPPAATGGGTTPQPALSNPAPAPKAGAYTVEQQSQTMAVPNPPGMVEPGNIPIWNRPTIQNADGSRSTELSISIQDENGHEVLVPTIVNGRFLTPDGKIPPGPVPRDWSKASPQWIALKAAAWNHFRQTGENLGKFDNAADAEAYANILHNRGQRPAPSQVPAGVTHIFDPTSGTIVPVHAQR